MIMIHDSDVEKIKNLLFNLTQYRSLISCKRGIEECLDIIEAAKRGYPEEHPPVASV